MTANRPPGPTLDAVVVGGGLTGLAAAHTLGLGGARARVLEASAVAGGVATTRRVGEFLFEAGPNTVPAGARHVRELAAAAGIADRLVGADPAAARRCLWFGGRLVELPSSLRAVLATPLLSWRAKWRVLTEPFRPLDLAAFGAEEPSLGLLLERRVGREATELVAGAAVRGIWAGDVDRLGAWSAFPELRALLERHGSLLRAMGGALRNARGETDGDPLAGARLLSFPEGLGELAAAVATSLGERLVLDTRAEALERRGDAWCVRDQRGGEWHAREVVLALGARATAALLSRAGLPDAARELAGLPHAGLRLVHLGFAPGVLSLPRVFGFLVPPRPALERRRAAADAPEALGVLFPSNLFAGRVPAGGAVVTAFYPEGWARGASEPQRVELAARELARALGLARAPAASETWCVDWPARLPQYEVGHAVRVAALERALLARAPGLHLAGSYTGGIAVDRVIARGRAVADRILRAADAVPEAS